MENNRKFNSVFEGLEQTQAAFEKQIFELQRINSELKEEWKKAKRFNIIMLIIALVSLAFAVASLAITLK